MILRRFTRKFAVAGAALDRLRRRDPFRPPRRLDAAHGHAARILASDRRWQYFSREGGAPCQSSNFASSSTRTSVKYVVISHSPAYTAQEIAASAHIPGHELAKTVIVKVDGELAMAVLPASSHVNLDLLGESIGVDHIELADEFEFRDRFGDCELGAMPPFGNLYGMDVYVADELTVGRTHCVQRRLAHRADPNVVRGFRPSGASRAHAIRRDDVTLGPASQTGVAAMTAKTTRLTLGSPNFAHGDAIAARHTCDGANVSPDLRWSAAPNNAQSFALIVDDPDAPSGTFTHWVLYDIPGAFLRLA